MTGSPGTNPREITERNFTLAAQRLGLNDEQQLLLKIPFCVVAPLAAARKLDFK